MSKYNDYRMRANQFEKFLIALSTHEATTEYLAHNRRVRMVKTSTGIPQVWTEIYKDGTGWTPEQEFTMKGGE